MKNKIIIVIVISLFVLIIGYGFYLATKSNKEVFPDKINVTDVNGQIFTLDNFKANSENYNDVSVLSSEYGYNIQYDDKNATFQITFMLPILEEVIAIRSGAEDDLLSKLNIGEEKACLLKVREVFAQADELSLPTGDYGLSFCSDSKPFPQENESLNLR